MDSMMMRHGGMAAAEQPQQQFSGGVVSAPIHQQQQQSAGGMTPSPESAAALQRAIASMEEKGLQSDPRYGQLLSLRARANQQTGNVCLLLHSYFDW